MDPQDMLRQAEEIVRLSSELAPFDGIMRQLDELNAGAIIPAVSKQLLLLGTPMTAAELLALVPAKYLRRIEAPDLPAVTREIARGG